MESELARVEALKDASGRIGGREVVVALSGIGKVNAAIAALDMIAAHAPDAIINTGIAGGADTAVADVMDVVAGVETAYHDIYCGPGFTRGTLQGLPQKFPGDPALLAAAMRGGAAAGVRLVGGLIASGEQFVDSTDQIAAIRSLYPTVAAVDMESAAIAHVCHLRGVPFLALRVISDVPGAPNQAAQYEGFWDTLGTRSFAALSELLRNL